MDRVEFSQQADLAWMFVEGAMDLRSKATGQQLRFSRTCRLLAVLVRGPQGWNWRPFHGSVPCQE